MLSKICIRCKKEKCLSEFYRNSQKKDGFSPYCKKCHNYICNESIKRRLKKDDSLRLQKNTLARALYAKNPDKYRLRSRKRTYEELKNTDLKHKYNITFKEYLEIWNKQNGVCAICGQPETRKTKGVLSMLCVDHDHKTGKIRGLLCFRCNTVLGKVNEDTNLFILMTDYLKKFENSINTRS